MQVLAVSVDTTDRCSRCVSAKMLLDQRGIPYQEVDLAEDADGRTELRRRTGMLTFPQIVIGDQTLGGYAELLAAEQAGQLTTLLTHRVG